MDALSETLRVVRLIGAIFINAKFTAPWCYQSECADSIAHILEPGAERVVIFHLITEGECYVEMEDQPPVKLIAGDVVLFPKGDAHLMTSQIGLPPVNGKRLDAVLERRPRQITFGGGAWTWSDETFLDKIHGVIAGTEQSETVCTSTAAVRRFNGRSGQNIDQLALGCDQLLPTYCGDMEVDEPFEECDRPEDCDELCQIP